MPIKVMKQQYIFSQYKRRIVPVTEFCNKNKFNYDEFMQFCKKTLHIMKTYTLDKSTGEYIFYLTLFEARYYQKIYISFLKKRNFKLFYNKTINEKKNNI